MAATSMTLPGANNKLRRVYGKFPTSMLGPEKIGGRKFQLVLLRAKSRFWFKNAADGQT